MSRFFIFIFTYILICFPFQAQKLISSTGGVIINSNSGSVSYSIGEPIISTISGGSNGDVTQGYQQSKNNKGTIKQQRNKINYNLLRLINGYTPFTKNLHAINISSFNMNLDVMQSNSN